MTYFEDYFPPTGRWVHCEKLWPKLGLELSRITCQQASYENCMGTVEEFIEQRDKFIQVPEGENTPYDSDWTAEDKADYQSPCSSACQHPKRES